MNNKGVKLDHQDHIYLRVVTDRITIRLPCVHASMEDGQVELVFNWIVLEQTVLLSSTQAFMEGVRPDKELTEQFSNVTGIIEDFELNEVEYLSPDDEMYKMEPREVGCFIVSVPLKFLLDINPKWPN